MSLREILLLLDSNVNVTLHISATGREEVKSVHYLLCSGAYSNKKTYYVEVVGKNHIRVNVI